MPTCVMLSTAPSRIRRTATYDGNNLDCTEPKLELTKEFDSKVVDGGDGNQEDGNPNTWIDFFARFPLLDDESRGSELVRSGDDIFGKIAPTAYC